MTRHKLLLGVLVCAALSAPSYAATVLEARVGDRDGATVGIGLSGQVNCARVGAVLEFGEDDSVSLLGRISKSWPNKVTPYIGLGAGIAIEETPVQGRAIPPDGRHGRSYAVPAGTDSDAGLALEAFAGLRGGIKPGLAWFVEAIARDQQVNDGAGFATGLLWRVGK